MREVGDINDTICTLTDVRGGFFSGNESVKVTANTGTQKWRLATASGASDDDETTAGGMDCVPRGRFYNSNSSNPGWHRHGYTLTGTGTMETAPMSDGKYAATLMGLKGDMDSGGYMSSVDQKQAGEESMLIMDSKGEQRTSYGLSWGLDTLGGGSRELGKSGSVSTLNSNKRARLAPVEDAFCYLTKVKGNFDGRGEYARIEKREGYWFVRAHASCEHHKGLLGLGQNCKQRHHVEAAASCYEYNQTP